MIAADSLSVAAICKQVCVEVCVVFSITIGPCWSLASNIKGAVCCVM
jgi:hypothetical protein